MRHPTSKDTYALHLLRMVKLFLEFISLCFGFLPFADIYSKMKIHIFFDWYPVNSLPCSISKQLFSNNRFLLFNHLIRSAEGTAGRSQRDKDIVAEIIVTNAADYRPRIFRQPVRIQYDPLEGIV